MLRNLGKLHVRLVRSLVIGLAAASACALVLLIAITCVDVVLRMCGSALSGSQDLMRFGGAIVAAGALPYTTAVKGHVTVEFFFQKLSGRGRIAVDTLMRTLTFAFFVLLSWRCLVHGASMRRAGEVSETLCIPYFWVPWLFSLSCLTVSLVILEHALRPGKELIRP